MEVYSSHGTCQDRHYTLKTQCLSGQTLHSQDTVPVRTDTTLSGQTLHSQDTVPVRTDTTLSRHSACQDRHYTLKTQCLSGQTLHSQDTVPVRTDTTLSGQTLHSQDTVPKHKNAWKCLPNEVLYGASAYPCRSVEHSTLCTTYTILASFPALIL